MADSQSLGQTVSHYRILERLGGGMGVVYKAKILGFTVSLAQISARRCCHKPSSNPRASNEAQAASVNHPNILYHPTLVNIGRALAIEPRTAPRSNTCQSDASN
jgi:hypothetical protein